ncbi:SGNH hydrolase [Mytilinidion resinicola]|uniref:SGNH hydrolase n=1 Tax=Mytilinidion resinicola TaxID=574789 RepID=A0A6A6YRA0_9PEZI|nr:SGNH hydrolase [Mytilinidion resinicola]KAF2811078.1 SGNH hydrolase [Mytilinidion resinicola]
MFFSQFRLCHVVALVLATSCNVTWAKEQVPLNTKHNSPQPLRQYSWVRSFASIGDSYAAGLGAGNRIDWSCSRYDHSYPSLLNSNGFLGENPNRTHQYLACSGATSEEVLVKQASALDDDLDVITVSAGGNDVGLSIIMNQCIYQFFMSKTDACEDALNETWSKIENDLSGNLTALLDVLKPKLNKGHGKIYYTGYARFFATDDEICDNVTWAVWSYESQSAKQFLTLERRKIMNDMVQAVNKKIEEAVHKAGDQVIFVDYDSFVAENKGRFCEAGVIEPDPNRNGLCFYEWKTVDTGDNSTALHHAGDDVPKGSFESDIVEWTNKTLQEHPDWKFGPDEEVELDADKKGGRQVIGDTVSWLLPDFWKRVFHLRPAGHLLIAHLLMSKLAETASKISASETVEGYASRDD